MTDIGVVLSSLNACPKMGAGNLKIQELMIPVFAVFYFCLLIISCAPIPMCRLPL